MPASKGYAGKTIPLNKTQIQPCHVRFHTPKQSLPKVCEILHMEAASMKESDVKKVKERWV